MAARESYPVYPRIPPGCGAFIPYIHLSLYIEGEPHGG